MKERTNEGRVDVQMRLLCPTLNPRTQLKIRKRLSPSSVSGLAPNSKQRHSTPRFDGREKERRFSLLSSPLLPPYPIGCRQAGRQLEEGGDLRQELVLPWDEQERRQRTEKERERPLLGAGGRAEEEEEEANAKIDDSRWLAAKSRATAERIS